MKGKFFGKFSLLVVVITALIAQGCAGIQQESFTLANGKVIDYIHGKVDADGQTGVFRDAFVDGVPVLSNFGSGQSLLGQVLQGTASSAMIAGGAVGAAALLRPTRINESNSFNNEQDQGQDQSQGQHQKAINKQAQGQEQGQASFNSNDVDSTNVNANSNSNSNRNSNSNHNKASNANFNANLNSNSSKAYGGHGGDAKAYGGHGGSGGQTCNGNGSCD